MGLSAFSVEPWCGNRLAVCVLHIACSQRLRRSEQNNNHKSGLSAECQDCLVVGSLQHTRGTLLSFAGKKCLRSQIPQTGHMLLGMKRVNHSPQFACVMLGLDDDDSLQVLTSWLKSQKHPRVEQGGLAYSSWKCLSYKICTLFSKGFRATAAASLMDIIVLYSFWPLVLGAGIDTVLFI